MRCAKLQMAGIDNLRMTMTVIGASLVSLLGSVLVTSLAAAEPSRPAKTGTEPAKLALDYAQALAVGRMTDWAKADLGCLARHRASGKGAAAELNQKEIHACWAETLAAHRAMVADEPETGVFGALGRGAGFGLLDPEHRQIADTWRDYPPGIFISPSIILQAGGSMPQLELVKVFPARVVGVKLGQGKEPVGLTVTPVELRVSYPDPLTAPLALRPGQAWWASGTVRHYGPVRDLRARFLVVSGLRAHGFPTDQALLNEALEDGPSVLGADGGRTAEIGRAFNRPGEETSLTAVKGGLVVGSARWWDRPQAQQAFDRGLLRANQLPAGPDKTRLLMRLLLLDPSHPEVNALLGNDWTLVFLREGLTKSGITAADEASRLRVAELYWNLQAQTWRQEFTEVAMGHSQAADSLYGSMAALELAIRGGAGTYDMRRRLGALYRWNNDSDSALATHESLLRDLSESNRRQRGQLLAELAWDRIQWVAWNRRYEHPWLAQAAKEAAQALDLVDSPLEKLIAAQALVMVEALAVSRDQARLEHRVKEAKLWHDQLSGVTGLWGYLIANDVTKSLIPEAAVVTLPSSARSLEVLDTEVHWKVPTQHLEKHWDFDRDSPGGIPARFAQVASVEGMAGTWRIESDPQAPTPPHVVAQPSPCQKADCFQLLLADAESAIEFPDVLVRMQMVSGNGQGGAGIVLGVKDHRNFFAVTVNLTTKLLAIHRVTNGQAVLLASASVKPDDHPWHLLRVQRMNFHHVSKPLIAVFFDGSEALAVAEETVPEVGRVGLVTIGDTVAKFDGFHLLELVANQPLSAPAAY